MNPFMKLPDGLDCDFFSIKVTIKSIVELSGFYSLTSSALMKVKDPRLHQCVAVTMDPIQLLAEIPQGRLVDAMRAHGITVFPNENDRVLSKTPGKRVHADDLAKVFETAGLTHVFAYGYGMKGHSQGLFKLLDKLGREGGAHDNMFDLGLTTDSDMIPLLRPKSRSANQFGQSQLSQANCYGLFKQLGQGYGGVDFVSHLGHKIQIYQKWTHWVKASTDAKRKMMIPTTFEAVERFERNFSILLVDLASVETRLGGYRIEITALGQTVRDAIQSIPSSQFNLNHWTRFGLFEQLLVDPVAILEACKHAKIQIAQKGYLNRRDSVKLTVEQRAVFVDMMNLIGVRMPGIFNTQLRMSGITSPPWDHWPNVATERRARPVPGGATYNTREMASWLKWRSALRGPGYTLSRVGGQVWDRRWGDDGDVNPEVDMTKFLKAMVTTVIQAEVADWRRQFVLLDTPRTLPNDFDRAIQNPSWLTQLQDMFARSSVQRPVSESEDEILVEFARSHDPILPVGGDRGALLSSSAANEPSSSPTPPDPAPEPRRSQPRQSLLPVQRVSSVTIPSQMQSSLPRFQSQGLPERSQGSRRSSVPSQQIEEILFYPTWAVVSMSAELLQSVHRKAREPRLGNEFRARAMHDGDDKVIMEFYYQINQRQDPPSGSPKGVKFWESQPRFCIFEPGSIANRWKGTSSREGLCDLYPRYKESRDAENPTRLSESDYIRS